MTDDSALEENDPYLNPAPAGTTGENVLSFDEQGSASVEHRKPDERPNTWKNSKAIQNCDDDKIKCWGQRARSGIVDYSVLGASVSYRGLGYGEARQYLCLTHVVNDCPHTRRLHRYRVEHPDAEVQPDV